MARMSDAVANNGTETGVEPKKERNDFYEIVGRIIDMGVKIVGVIPYMIARILENFIEHEKGGIKVLGAILLCGGVVLSADGLFQVFGGKPLFPWYEREWIGIGWLWVWTKVNFWAAITASLAIQWAESWTLRGKTPDQAKVAYEEIKHHQTPAKNQNAIDLVERRRLEYKRAGMGERSIVGLFILIVFAIDIGATFHARNPWGKEPGDFIAILLYNLLTLVAGEVGLALWRKATGKN